MRVKVSIDSEFMPTVENVSLKEAREFAEINCPHLMCPKCDIGVMKDITKNGNSWLKCLKCQEESTYFTSKYTYSSSPFKEIE